MYASLPKDKARSLPKEMKDDLQRALQPALLLRELMKAETYAQKHEILDPHVEKMEKLNQTMKPWLSEQKYDEILKKVEAQLKRQISATTARSGSGRFKHPGLYPARNRTQSGLEPVRLLRVFCIHKSVKN